jgi:hypothetical protein
MQAPGDDDHKLTQIADTCRWYATEGPPTPQRQAAALAELAHITNGQTDLLARYAGQALSHHAPTPATDRAIQLCITAGADMTQISHWSHQTRHISRRN